MQSCITLWTPEMPGLQCVLTVVRLMQVRVTGAQYGKWGREKYGIKPQKLDALDFYPDRLQELWRNIQEEQVSPVVASQPLLCNGRLVTSSTVSVV